MGVLRFPQELGMCHLDMVTLDQHVFVIISKLYHIEVISLAIIASLLLDGICMLLSALLGTCEQVCLFQ